MQYRLDQQIRLTSWWMRRRIPPPPNGASLQAWRSLFLKTPVRWMIAPNPVRCGILSSPSRLSGGQSVPVSGKKGKLSDPGGGSVGTSGDGAFLSFCARNLDFVDAIAAKLGQGAGKAGHGGLEGAAGPYLPIRLCSRRAKAGGNLARPARFRRCPAGAMAALKGDPLKRSPPARCWVEP